MKTISTVGLQAAAASRLKFTPDHARLYDLIFRRAVASQMAPARYNATTLLFNVAGEKFKAVVRVLKFDGILKVYTTADEDKGWGTPPPPVRGVNGGPSEPQRNYAQDLAATH